MGLVILYFSVIGGFFFSFFLTLLMAAGAKRQKKKFSFPLAFIKAWFGTALIGFLFGLAVFLNDGRV